MATPYELRAAAEIGDTQELLRLLNVEMADISATTPDIGNIDPLGGYTSIDALSAASMKGQRQAVLLLLAHGAKDRKSTRLNSSHVD